jgi:hypothetical protein
MMAALVTREVGESSRRVSAARKSEPEVVMVTRMTKQSRKRARWPRSYGSRRRSTPRARHPT